MCVLRGSCVDLAFGVFELLLNFLTVWKISKKFRQFEFCIYSLCFSNEFRYLGYLRLFEVQTKYFQNLDRLNKPASSNLGEQNEKTEPKRKSHWLNNHLNAVLNAWAYMGYIFFALHTKYQKDTACTKTFRLNIELRYEMSREREVTIKHTLNRFWWTQLILKI